MWRTCAGRALTVILVCIIIDILAYAALANRRDPLSIPLSLAAGKFRSPAFVTNWSTGYDIQIVAKSVDLATEMGVDLVDVCGVYKNGATTFPHAKYCVVRANWILRSSGVIVARGTTDDTLGQGYSWSGHTWRSIGGFYGIASKRYDLEVDFTKDGSRLAFAHPRLEVTFDENSRENAFVSEICLVVLLAVLLVVGLGIIIFVRAKAILRDQASRSG